MCNLIDYQPPGHNPEAFGTISFFDIYTLCSSVGSERIKCQLSYFHVWATQPEAVNDAELEMIVGFHRRVLAPEKVPVWATFKEGYRIQKIQVTNNCVEQVDCGLHVDFANKDLHIGCIIPSCTQEEVLFSIRPELFVGLLFSETMLSTEVIVMTGTRQYNSYSGYANSFRFEGCCNIDENIPAAIVAMDASLTVYHLEQYSYSVNVRDINKAFLGFCGLSDLPPRRPSLEELHSDPKHVVATGQWGGGVFRGDNYLKFVQQVLAATAAGKLLVYCAFGNAHLQQRLQQLAAKLENKTVAEVWLLLVEYEPGTETFEQYIFRCLE
eukprot:m.9542 g.9542  ORF g.9542 m.9542 type:complete len:325 (-) comp7214_c1_seq1:196-1170(-)